MFLSLIMFFCCVTPAALHVFSNIYQYNWYYFIEYLKGLGMQGTHLQISNVIFTLANSLITPIPLFNSRYLFNALLLQWTAIFGVILMAEFVVCAYHYISTGGVGVVSLHS